MNVSVQFGYTSRAANATVIRATSSRVRDKVIRFYVAEKRAESRSAAYDAAIKLFKSFQGCGRSENLERIILNFSYGNDVRWFFADISANALHLNATLWKITLNNL